MTGYATALAKGADALVKVDGDGQMNPVMIPRFAGPIVRGEADYTRGNRFFAYVTASKMPPVRKFGNAVLSFLTKASSGYWQLFDPTNDYTAIHARIAELLPRERIAMRYFFESDLLFQLGMMPAVVSGFVFRRISMKTSVDRKSSRVVNEWIVTRPRMACDILDGMNTDVSAGVGVARW